ncbi:adenosylcobinamide-GDP ribazoletransferase [Novosphingobium terrae]|uniref:adenosylcobinamide-GDP ribazoletransferase n=1 Tax=Novosphingobium terrae TaxID=2726189 RepID=UPI00197CC19A|nr:adenosylcobinamide-GDP ribazoletransferase [Novosphingobium terrae]
MSLLRRRWSEAQVALMLLTRLPAGRLRGDVPTLAQAAWAFPLAGLGGGAIVGGIFALGQALGWPASVAAGVALVAGLLVTGGLHEDGLGDVADGFGGGQTRERKLEIMKDSRLGSYGAIALVMALGLRWLLLAQLGDVWRIVAIAVASRSLLVGALAVMPVARADGLGRSASGVGAVRLVVGLVLGGLALVAGLEFMPGLIVGLVMTGAVTATGLIAWRQIGGQTGDVLGTMQVVGEIAGWLALLSIPA